MKKFTPILGGIVVFSLCTASLFASDSGDIKKTYYGALFGLNFGKLIGENSSAAEIYGGGEKGSRIGIAAGAFAHLGISNIFAIEPQFLYSQKGGKYKDIDPALNDRLILKIDYIEVPVIVRVYIPPIPVVKANVFGGGYFGLNTVADYKYKETGYVESGNIEDIVGVNAENIDYGLVFGAGAAYPISKVIVRLDLKYSLGKIWDSPPDDDIKNGVFSIIISVGL